MLVAILALGAPKAAHVDLSTEDVPRLRVFASGQELLWARWRTRCTLLLLLLEPLCAAVAVAAARLLCCPGNASWAGHRARR